MPRMIMEMPEDAVPPDAQYYKFFASGLINLCKWDEDRGTVMYWHRGSETWQDTARSRAEMTLIEWSGRSADPELTELARKQFNYPGVLHIGELPLEEDSDYAWVPAYIRVQKTT